MLDQDQLIGGAVHMLGVLVFVWSCLRGWTHTSVFGREPDVGRATRWAALPRAQRTFAGASSNHGGDYGVAW